MLTKMDYSLLALAPTQPDQLPEMTLMVAVSVEPVLPMYSLVQETLMEADLLLIIIAFQLLMVQIWPLFMKQRLSPLMPTATGGAR